MRRLHLYFYALLTIFVVACSSDDNYSDSSVEKGDYTHGIFVINEGNFGSGNTEISFINSNFSTVTNSIYGINNNGRSLGDVAQSIAMDDELVYIVVNNSDKIVVVNRHTFEHIADIDSGLSLPRYIEIKEDKGYVTNWGEADNAFVSVVDLNTFKVIDRIDVSYGPEKILEHENLLYVVHKGGFGQSNKLTIIDADNHRIMDVIEVGDMPNSIQIVGNDLWVLSSGNPSWTDTGETHGNLLQIDLGSLDVKNNFVFDAIEDTPESLEYDQGNLYYTIPKTDWETFETESHVYKLNKNSTVLPTESVLSVNKAFYSTAIKNGLYFGGDAKDYSSNGSVVVYDLENGEQVYESSVGVSPNGFYFTEN